MGLRKGLNLQTFFAIGGPAVALGYRVGGRALSMVLIWCICTVVSEAQVGSAGGVSAAPLKTFADNVVLADNCLVSARETIDVPALERGALGGTHVIPGTAVQAGQLLATLDDAEAKLALRLSQQELRVAEQKLKASRAVEIAAAGLAEAEQLLAQSERDAEIAKLAAEDESAVRLAEKLEQLAASDLEVARARRAVSRNSYSEQEWLKLQNQHEQAMIRLEAAGRERRLAGLRQVSKDAEVGQQRARLQSLQSQLEAARESVEAEKLTLQGLQLAVELAELRLQKRQLTAPFPGVIVEQSKFAGEWLESGHAVYRLMRLDRLSVEGFVSPEVAAELNSGQRVAFERPKSTSQPIEGTLIFISPAIDALNKSVRIRAEVSAAGALRPGEVVRMRRWTVGLPESPKPDAKDTAHGHTAK